MLIAIVIIGLLLIWGYFYGRETDSKSTQLPRSLKFIAFFKSLFQTLYPWWFFFPYPREFWLLYLLVPTAFLAVFISYQLATNTAPLYHHSSSWLFARSMYAQASARTAKKRTLITLACYAVLIGVAYGYVLIINAVHPTPWA